MKGPTRLLGITLLLAAMFGSLLYTAETLAQAAGPTPTVARSEPVGAEPESDQLDEQSTAMGYADGFPSGIYRIRAEPDDGDESPVDGKVYSIAGDDAATTSLSDDISLLGLAFRGPLEPGIYATEFDATDCQYELRRTMREVGERVIGHDRLREGRMLVTINEFEPDTFIATGGCGAWTPWSPLDAPLKKAGDGDYWLGDLAQGVWKVPNGCYWEKVVAFRGADLADVVDNGTGPKELVVDEATVGVRVRTCDDQNMNRVGPAPSSEL